MSLNDKKFGKASKGEVDYRIGSNTRKCVLCTMFREPDKCTAVQGKISKGTVCDLFEHK